MNESLFVSNLVSVISAITALIAAAFTGVSALTARKAYRAQTDANVIVYIAPQWDEPEFASLVVKNIGASLATDITMSFDTDIPWSRCLQVKVDTFCCRLSTLSANG